MLVRKLADAGYRVPSDISVVGFDNYINKIDNFVSELVNETGLTTYEINMKEMAKRTIHIMLHKMENMNYTTGMFVIPGRLIERGSVRRIGEEIPFI